MYKSLFALTVILLLIAACSDKAANNSGLLPFDPGNSNTQTALLSSEGDDLNMTVTPKDGTTQTDYTHFDPFAVDPNFSPDTVYASDYIVSESSHWTSHVVLSDCTTGEVLSEIWYDFSTL